MVLARVVSSVCGDAAGCYLMQQVWQHGGTAHIAAGHLDRPYRQCQFIHTDMYLAPEAGFAASMLARAPLALTFHLDACAFDQQMQGAFGALTSNGN